MRRTEAFIPKTLNQTTKNPAIMAFAREGAHIQRVYTPAVGFHPSTTLARDTGVGKIFLNAACRSAGGSLAKFHRVS